MTKQEEFERIIVLKLQEIRQYIIEESIAMAFLRVIQLEKLVKDHGTETPSIKP